MGSDSLVSAGKAPSGFQNAWKPEGPSTAADDAHDDACELLRLFVAITFDNEVKDRLAAARDALFLQAERGRRIERAQLHLTLAFLGAVETEGVFTIEDALDEVTNPLANTLRFTRYGSFGTGRRGRGATWWAGIERNDALAQLQGAVAKRLEKAGFPSDEKPWVAHVTLGRNVELSGPPCPFEPFDAHISSFSLMESRASENGASYEEICRWE